MKTLTVEEATSGLGSWVERALAGEQIRIRKGNGIVELRPTEPVQPLAGEQLAPREVLRLLQEDGRLTWQQADGYLKELREERLAAEIAWSEFLNGPVRSLEINRAEAVLQSRIVSFGQPEAILAADLFNKTGWRRGSRFDCFIAATSILAKAETATVNQSDFKAFVPHRLKLAAVTRRL